MIYGRVRGSSAVVCRSPGGPWVVRSALLDRADLDSCCGRTVCESLRTAVAWVIYLGLPEDDVTPFSAVRERVR